MKDYTIDDMKASLRRAFTKSGKLVDLDVVWIRMDGSIAGNKFLTDTWNFAVEKRWMTVDTIELEQETFMKGYLTKYGAACLGIG